ncbi:hypothetical protein [Lewinella sp. LCG006]|uniref:hypothetical protein n=1 Tax=Lewinella sp. LCG006 TaxID=3231911 RepID=UPI0034611709
MKKQFLFSIALCSLLFTRASTQAVGEDAFLPKHFIGSTLFVLATPILSPSPEYFQLNFGCVLSPKDVVSIEAITWAYRGPLGRPYGPDYENENSNFPGKVKALGLGLAYKRFLWKGVYGQVHATAFRQNFLDEQGDKIQSGFQLFNTLRFGYHFRLFKNRLFLEPSIAATSWPINTNLPDSFQVEEDKWNKYFLFEPGLHFGVNF